MRRMSTPSFAPSRAKLRRRRRQSVTTVRYRARLWFAVLSAATILTPVAAQTPAPKTAPAADAAWPRAAVADPAALGFTKGGLEALEARLKQSVADGDTAGMTYILLRHGQV